MFKKIIALILSAAAAASACSFALADEDKVEISFKVGDSILKINGTDTEVDTPYVAGEGVTLVPLRVITEAFGTQVDWDGETKSITLTYPDVNIKLQIGNIVAEINDHSETLLEPPVLSENGVTMVPLRFISETFGATVGYDADTQAILVTKEKIKDADTVTGITDMQRTGDSYYGWSIDTPVNMKMTDRRLDGLSTTFTADDGSKLYIDIYTSTKEDLTPFDERYSNVQDSFSTYTLTEAEKLTDEKGNQYMHFTAKDKEQTVDFKEYYGSGYKRFQVSTLTQNNADSSVKNMLAAISDSFRLEVTADTYDLSTVAGKVRTIKDDKYKFSMEIPADYHQSVDENLDNDFTFYSPDKNSNARVSFAIYSKTADTTAYSLAQKDRASHVKNLNPEYAVVSDVTGSDDGTYRYTVSISGSAKSDSYTTDTFFEKGDYVYNLSVIIDGTDDLFTPAGMVINSLRTEELDSKEIGKLLRNDPDTQTKSSKTVGAFTFDLPTSWKSVTTAQTVSSDLHSESYVNSNTGSTLSVAAFEDDEYTRGNVSPIANKYYKYVKDNAPKKAEFEDVDVTNIGDKRVATFSYTATTDSGYKYYETFYLYTNYQKMIVFSLRESDIHYHKSGNDDIINAVSGFTMK